VLHRATKFNVRVVIIYARNCVGFYTNHIGYMNWFSAFICMTNQTLDKE
jgi:hypothetical protein